MKNAKSDGFLHELLFLPPPCLKVRVKILASGVCGTDEYSRSGADPEGK